jgi:hypothetical protein
MDSENKAIADKIKTTQEVISKIAEADRELEIIISRYNDALAEFEEAGLLERWRIMDFEAGLQYWKMISLVKSGIANIDEDAAIAEAELSILRQKIDNFVAAIARINSLAQPAKTEAE